MPVEVYVAGMRSTLRAVRAAGDDVQKATRDEFRGVVAPTVADIRGRFARLGRTGPRTARTVSGSFAQNRVEMRMGGRGGPKWGFELGTEFGAKGPKTSTFVQRRPAGPVRVTRTVDYSKVFGRWTGNQFDPPAGRVSGRAFYPGVADHYDDLVEGVARALDSALDRVGKAGV